MVDYTKTSLSTCKSCKDKISKGNLRISKLVPFRTTHIDAYYHANCIFDAFIKAKSVENVITSSDDLAGFDKIEPEDKCKLDELIRNYVTHQCKFSIKDQVSKSKAKEKEQKTSQKSPI